MSTKLEAIQLKDVVAIKQPLVSISEECTLEVAAKTLVRYKCLSLPVRDAEPESARPCHRFSGILTLWDIISAICFDAIETPTGRDADMSTNEFQKLIRDEAFLEPSSEYLSTVHEKNPNTVFSGASSLLEVMEVFGRGAHRVLVHLSDVSDGPSESKEDDDSAVLVEHQFRYISQSDVVKYLMQHVEQVPALNDLLNQSLLDLGLVSDSPDPDEAPICVKTTVAALNAFRRMGFYKASAIAVLNTDGTFAHELSNRSLRGISSAELTHLTQTVEEFSKIHPSHSVQCSPDTNLQSILSDMLKAGAHRAWVLDPQKSPLGVVSLTDVIALVTSKIL